MKLKNIKTFEQHASELNIYDVISRLLSLQRVDIDTYYNGEFIEQEERIEKDGKYIRSEDLDKLISELKQSIK